MSVLEVPRFARGMLVVKGRGHPESGLIPRGSKTPQQRKDSGNNGADGEDISWEPSCIMGVSHG